MKLDIIYKWLLLLLVTIHFLALLLLFFCSRKQVNVDMCYDGQNLPHSAVNGEWLAQLTPQHDISFSDIKELVERSIVVRIKVLEERHDIHPLIKREYYLDHIFSIYRAEILEIYFIRKNTDFLPEIGRIIEFSQVKRIVGEVHRRNWFESIEPPTDIFPPVRLPVLVGDELVLFFSQIPSSFFLNPINGTYRYSPDKSIEGNRAFENVNEHNNLILTEEDLLRISEMFPMYQPNDES